MCFFFFFFFFCLVFFFPRADRIDLVVLECRERAYSNGN